jgi:hypothetical protein
LFPFLVCTVVLIVASLIIAIVQFNTGPFYGVLTLVVALIYFFLCVFALYQHAGLEAAANDY